MLEFEAGRPAKIDLKSGQRHKNDPLHGTEGSFVLLKSKNKVKPSTKSLDFYGEIGMIKLG